MNIHKQSLLDHAIFEIIPMRHAAEKALGLPAGSTVSVTASPAKGMMATVELTEHMVEHGYVAIPHLSARLTKSHGELQHIVERFLAIGIERVFIVGGDADDPGDFFDAMSLIDALVQMGRPFADMGVTGYPEGHPDIPEESLQEALIAKQPHAAYVATQMCFDTDRIRDWALSIRQLGVMLPLMVGIPGAIDATKLMTIGARIGVGRSLRYLSKNRKSVTKLIRPGRYQPDDLLDDLAELAADPVARLGGLHIFTFNQVDETVEWYQQARAAD